MTQGEDIVPIPGTKRRDRLDENVGSLKITLSKSELEMIDVALPRGQASGNRYADMSTVNR